MSSVRRFFKSLSTQGVSSLVVVFVVYMSHRLRHGVVVVGLVAQAERHIRCSARSGGSTFSMYALIVFTRSMLNP